MKEDTQINVWGARVHNLKNVDVVIPRNSLNVITGLSGSAVVNSQTVELSQELQRRQKAPDRKVYFCGSWSCDGLPILESAVTSAMQIAKNLGAPIPFVGLKPKPEVAPELGY